MNRLFFLVIASLVPASMLSAPPPHEALARMRVAEGFEVKLVAGEPHIRQPLSVSFDSRGRMWVIQYLQYPNPAGLKAVSVDQYLRTKYDRVPEPPPRGPRGADRITICEDTDRDGVADRFKDFVSDLNLASGMALGHGGVFVVQPPYLLFYADKNRDDVPDGAPDVLLSGFGMEDSHALANSLTWGPDGWLYGAQGSTVTANIRGIGFQQGIWRYHPITREFELFAEGGGNTWGLDFDSEGEVIAGTNFGEQIALHQVQGAYYVKGFAKHGPLHNPHTYGYFEHVPYTGWQGGRVICGGVIYDGGAFGAEYNGSYIAANLLLRTVDWHALEPNGSTIKGRFGGAFIRTDDETFRPVDCAVGPDGAVYVSDWCDPRASHVDPIDNWEKETGRIYKIQRKEGALPRASAGRNSQPGRGEQFDLATWSSEALVNLLQHQNGWFREQARALLAERRDTNVIPRLREQAVQGTNASLALESLWALCVSGGFDDSVATNLLRHAHAPVRAWAVRLIGDTKSISPGLKPQLLRLARSETSPVVRRQLACSAKRWPAGDALPIVRELLQHDDVADPHIPLLLWWAIEDKAISAAREVMGLLASATDWHLPLVRLHLLERLARRYASETNSEAQHVCSWLLHTAPVTGHQSAVLRGFDKAWEGQRITRDAGLRDSVAAAWKRNSDDALGLRVGLRIGLAEAQDRAIARLTNAAVPEAERIALAETLGQCGVERAIPALARLLADRPKLQVAAIVALQNFAAADVPSLVLERYPRLAPEAQTRARTALAARSGWAMQLVRAVESGGIEARELSPDQLRQMVRHNDAPLTAAVERRWGKLQADTPAEKTIVFNTLKLVLNPSGTTHRFKGNAAEGKKVFQQACATCHKLFDEGNSLGPELTGSDRKNTDWLLSQIIDASAFIRPEYVNHNVEMKDGRSLSGLIVEESDSAITLVDAQNQRTVLSRAEISELTPSSTSLMPDGLLEALAPQQVRDLFSYLQSD